jgi:hypothetical protein
MLLVLEVDPLHRFRFQLTADRLEAELVLAPIGPARTLAQLAVVSQWRVTFRRSLPRMALERLHALCQFSASPEGGEN